MEQTFMNLIWWNCTIIKINMWVFSKSLAQINYSFHVQQTKTTNLFWCSRFSPTSPYNLKGTSSQTSKAMKNAPLSLPQATTLPRSRPQATTSSKEIFMPLTQIPLANSAFGRSGRVTRWGTTNLHSAAWHRLRCQCVAVLWGAGCWQDLGCERSWHT